MKCANKQICGDADGPLCNEFCRHQTEPSEQGATAPVEDSPSSGWVPSPKCAIKDTHGNHCPEKPAKWTNLKSNGNEVHLCARCYQNALEQGLIEAPNSSPDGNKGDKL